MQERWLKTVLFNSYRTEWRLLPQGGDSWTMTEHSDRHSLCHRVDGRPYDSRATEKNLHILGQK